MCLIARTEHEGSLLPTKRNPTIGPLRGSRVDFESCFQDLAQMRKEREHTDRQRNKYRQHTETYRLLPIPSRSSTPWSRPVGVGACGGVGWSWCIWVLFLCLSRSVCYDSLFSRLRDVLESTNPIEKSDDWVRMGSLFAGRNAL